VKQGNNIHLHGCHMWSANCLPFLSTWVHPQF